MTAIAHTTKTPFRRIDTVAIDILQEKRKDGAILLRSTVPLHPHPHRMTDRLLHWAMVTPDRIFIAQKNAANTWDTLTYSQTLDKVRTIAQSLLTRNLSVERPVAILSGNSIEHALMALAALHAGIPHSPVTPAYSLRSTDFEKLKYVIRLLTPGLVFVSDGKMYEKALKAVGTNAEIVVVSNPPPGMKVTMFDELFFFIPTSKVDKAFDTITPDTIAKILFTSGSTGLPKGVINTHGNISANWQQITQTFPFMKEEGLEFIDWLPWNHTFGGNHNLGLTLYNGGSFYLDDGNPTPAGIMATVANLKERKPTIYFNVPKGFEALVPYFKNDEQLRRQFFSDVKMLFYAGAGMPQHVWNTWEEMAAETVGEKIVITTGLGCTETSPSALFASWPGGHAGLLGVPVPGLELKLVQVNDKLEARYRGPNVFPGYWRQPELTVKVFDEEGFYCTADALRFADINNPNKGMIFDGRLAEDFKLNTGTWVHVGVLRTQMIAAGSGLIQDVVLTGHDADFIAAIVFVNFDRGRKVAKLSRRSSIAEIIANRNVKQKLQQVLDELASKSTGSATLIRRAILADFDLSIDKGEITDKGSVNQRIIIQHYPEIVKRLYAATIDNAVLEAVR